MSIETTLKSLISPLVAGGCHNVANTLPTITIPYVVFYEISAVPENGITEYLGATNHQYQIDIFAKTPEQAKGLALGAIKTAIESSTLAGVLVFHSVGEYSEIDKTYQYITQFQIWAE
jgi:hypothetical protein